MCGLVNVLEEEERPAVQTYALSTVIHNQRPHFSASPAPSNSFLKMTRWMKAKEDSLLKKLTLTNKIRMHL